MHWVPHRVKNGEGCQAQKNPIFKAIYHQKIILVPFDRENSGESIGILKIILKNSALSYKDSKL